MTWNRLRLTAILYVPKTCICEVKREEDIPDRIIDIFINIHSYIHIHNDLMYTVFIQGFIMTSFIEFTADCGGALD